MKTFLNVLYRRILYKIPLKLLLVLLAIFGVLFACFSNASFQIEPLYVETHNDSTHQNIWWNGVPNSDVYCLIDSVGSFSVSLNCNSDYIDLQLFDSICVSKEEFPNHGHDICIRSNVGYTVGVLYYSTDSLDVPYTSLECQTEYNLIPISSVDQNYCTTNNLCPSQECPDIPVRTGEYSQLYINNILHLGAPNIIMNIPDEIDWDYAYTQGGQNMNIDVVGYNVDYEKIDEIVQLQNYKPTSEDFQKIIGLLAPYTKIIVFFVFLFIIWAWIKKPFRSKKL